MSDHFSPIPDNQGLGGGVGRGEEGGGNGVM